MVKNEKSMQEEKKVRKPDKKHAEEKSQNKKKENKTLKGDKETAKKTPEQQNEATPESEVSVDEKSAELILEEIIREKEEKYLRLAAEFDNYRKRTLKEKFELTKLAGEEIINGLLPVIDDFDRALNSMSNSKDIDAMKKGIDLINVKLREFLKQKGVKEINALGTDFDTDLHEAVTKIPVTAKKDKGKIVDVIEKGYLLHDKVIRYSKVVVGE